MTAYILKGDPREVEKVIRENRIRVSRGVISFTPAKPERLDDKETAMTDSKEAHVTDTKTVKRPKKSE